MNVRTIFASLEKVYNGKRGRLRECRLMATNWHEALDYARSEARRAEEAERKRWNAIRDNRDELMSLFESSAFAEARRVFFPRMTEGANPDSITLFTKPNPHMRPVDGRGVFRIIELQIRGDENGVLVVHPEGDETENPWFFRSPLYDPFFARDGDDWKLKISEFYESCLKRDDCRLSDYLLVCIAAHAKKRALI